MSYVVETRAYRERMGREWVEYSLDPNLIPKAIGGLFTWFCVFSLKYCLLVLPRLDCLTISSAIETLDLDPPNWWS